MSLRTIDLDAFTHYYGERKNEVNHHISGVLDEKEEFPDLRQLLKLAVQGGKRIRAVLTMLMADATDCQHETALRLATIVELLHTATLVSDDWVDNDDFRRDLPAVWRVLYGIADRGPDWVTNLSDAIPNEVSSRTVTVLTSHNLQAITLQLVHNTAVQRAMGTGVRDVFKGFYLEGKHRTGNEWTGGYDAYIEASRYKTGGFFALSTWLPAIVTLVEQEVVDAARQYGESLGILYQVTDDIADGDLPDVIEDPEAELLKWYNRAINELATLPIERGTTEYVLLETAPAWASYRLLDQEGIDLEPPFMGDHGETAVTESME